MSTRPSSTSTTPSANELPTPSQPRIGLVGDTHADTMWTTSVIKMFAQQGIDMIVQLGDFGWWPHLTFVDTVARCAARHEVTFAFIDGNHEDHTDLQRWANLRHPDRSPADPVEMHPSLWYLPRGCAWEWHGVRLRACGGAFSIDYQARIPGLSWFPDSEEPSNDDIRRTIAAGPADVLLTHDHPELGYKLPGIPGVPDKLERMSAGTRLKLAAVVEEVKPKLVVHGHWHQTYVERIDGLTVAGLTCNRRPTATTILDLETLQTDTTKADT